MDGWMDGLMGGMELSIEDDRDLSNFRIKSA